MTEKKSVEDTLSEESLYLLGRIRFLETALALTLVKLPAETQVWVMNRVADSAASINDPPISTGMLQSGFQSGEKNLVKLLVRSAESLNSR